MINVGRLLLGAVIWFAIPLWARASDPWIAPTAEELALKSIPEVPGAGAVILYKEQKTTSWDNTMSIYVRIKVLNESGKDRANVELPFGGSAETSYRDIEGRTIHSDGTIIPLTSKPFEKIVEKVKDYKVKVKVFTLPAVEVGSIIEYRYKLSGYLGSPDWFIQSDLFTRSAHYVWDPQGSGIAWTPILPPDTTVKTLKGGSELMLDIQNVPPLPKEDMMPPMGSVSYRVLFYYTRFHSADEFWKSVGEEWSKSLDKFIGPDKSVRAAVAELTAPTDTDEQKLRKIYAAVMSYENTDFDRRLTAQELKARGLKDLKSAGDIIVRRRGSGDQLAVAFVAMARAAGLKAYLMAVADRSERIFLSAYMNFGQIDDYIVIVNLNGVETYFDPGERYTPFGQLAWFHAISGGLRETATGTEIAYTPSVVHTASHFSRLADLAMDENGVATGKVVFKFQGDPARRWRQRALLGDETSLKADLRTELEDMLPAGMEVSVVSVGDLADSEKLLQVAFDVSGKVGSLTGKRLLLPANLFRVNAKPRFPSEKRDVEVDMQYASVTQDAVRYRLPAGMAIESVPVASKEQLKGAAAFDTSSKVEGNYVTLFRNLVMGHVIFPTSAYPDLRGFYRKIEARDQDTVVLGRTPEKASSN